MVCGNFILPEPASYVFFYAVFNLRKLLYIIASKPQPENAGKPWNDADDAVLCQMFDAGGSKKEMCAYFKRSEGSLAARLVRLGKISDRAEFRNK